VQLFGFTNFFLKYLYLFFSTAANMEEYMKMAKQFLAQRRGSNRFSDFDYRILKIYKRYKGLKKVNEFFPEILTWCSLQ
jgi:hypothetical protein